MNQDEITLDEDVKRLIRILNTKTKYGRRQFTIYSCYDKRRPHHSLVYYDPDTVFELVRKGFIKIEGEPKYNIDENAAGYAGPPHYVVTVLVENPLPLPKGVKIIDDLNKYALQFSDGKELDFADIYTDSAKYFKLLIENHGLDVRHDVSKEMLKEAKTSKQIRGLVDSIKDKARRRTISNRISIESEHKAAYKLLVTFTPKKNN